MYICIRNSYSKRAGKTCAKEYDPIAGSMSPLKNK
jgi:hypothetical protein